LDYYDKYIGKNRWAFSNISSLSIGQGELLVTPIQMANLGAILANRGYYFTPHILKEIEGEPPLTYPRNRLSIDENYFDLVVEGMEQVIKMGSGRRAYIPDLAICGKTSTVENPHGMDHSGFMGFAPMDNPKIAIAVYVENAGWGGRAAGSTASLVIEKYIKGEITRPWVEEFVLQGDFLDAKQKKTVEEMEALKAKMQ
ncbi:MAG: penicillin-binding protein 2, partial [Marinoscillum sp.]